MTVVRHNVMHVYWSPMCRSLDAHYNGHEYCGGLWECPPEFNWTLEKDYLTSTTKDFTRCVCPCHDGFDPDTGERMN
jgi:hypothetical protein